MPFPNSAIFEKLSFGEVLSIIERASTREATGLLGELVSRFPTARALMSRIVLMSPRVVDEIGDVLRRDRPAVDVNGANQRADGGPRLYSSSFQALGAAGAFAAFRLINPAGSGMVGVIVSASVQAPGAASVKFQFEPAAQAVLPAFPDTTPLRGELAAGPAFNPGLLTPCMTDAAGTPNVANTILDQATLPASVIMYMFGEQGSSHGLLTIGPNQSFCIMAQTLNQVLRGHVRYYEIPQDNFG